MSDYPPSRQTFDAAGSRSAGYERPLTRVAVKGPLKPSLAIALQVLGFGLLDQRSDQPFVAQQPTAPLRRKATTPFK